MARPIKQGLDYFTLDCFFDDKVELVIAEFGMTGLGILVRLFQKIYSDCGYYCYWNDDVALLFSRQNGLGGNVVSEVIDACIRRGVFHCGMYEHCSILTSEGIQRRYFEAVKRRSCLNLKNEYLLITVPNNEVFVNNNSVNADNNSQIAGSNPQSRVKESKVKKSKVKESVSKADFAAPTLEEVKAYIAENNYIVEAVRFYSNYESKNWTINGSPLTNWRAKIDQWNSEDKKKLRLNDGIDDTYDLNEIEKRAMFNDEFDV